MPQVRVAAMVPVVDVLSRLNDQMLVVRYRDAVDIGMVRVERRGREESAKLGASDKPAPQSDDGGPRCDSGPREETAAFDLGRAHLGRIVQPACGRGRDVLHRRHLAA